MDPDIITGYNIQNFDLPYLLDRAKHLKVMLQKGYTINKYGFVADRFIFLSGTIKEYSIVSSGIDASVPTDGK